MQQVATELKTSPLPLAYFCTDTKNSTRLKHNTMKIPNNLLMIQKTKTMKTVVLFAFVFSTLTLFAQTPDQVLYHIDDTRENIATSVATVPGEIAVTGYAFLEPREEKPKTALPFICKKDHHGNVIWMRTYHLEGEDDPGLSLYPNNIIKTSDGGYLLGGNLKLSDPFNNNMFLIKADTDGNLEWFSIYGCESLPLEGIRYCDGIYLHHITENLEGGYLISGSNSFVNDTTSLALAIKVDVNGSVTMMKDYYQPGHQENDLLKSFNLSNGDYISLVRSTKTVENGGKQDKAILRKMDQQFNLIWEKSIINENTEMGFYAWDLTVDLNGNYIILGQAENDQNILTKVNGSGNVQWATTYDKPSGVNIFRPRALTKDQYGNLYFTGFMVNQGESPSYAIKTDANGSKQWSKIYGNNRPFSDTKDIELIKFPENEFTYGDNFVFVGYYGDSTTTSTPPPSWVVNGPTANGETGCRHDDFTVTSNEENYNSVAVSFEESDLVNFTLDIVMESPEREYTRIACNPFYFPLAENNSPDQLHLVPEVAESRTELKVIIGPNPNSGAFSIFTELPATTENGTQGQVHIFDSLGRLVTKKTIDNQQNIHFENFPKGTYLVKATYGNYVSNHRLFVQ